MGKFYKQTKRPELSACVRNCVGAFVCACDCVCVHLCVRAFVCACICVCPSRKRVTKRKGISKADSLKMNKVSPRRMSIKLVLDNGAIEYSADVE